jgi:hypothetical protein
LTVDEIAILKQGVVLLAKLGQSPGHISRAAAQVGALSPEREDFARMMREQSIAANATSHSIRGKTRGKTKDAIFRAQQRGASTAARNRVTDVVKEVRSTGAIRDPAQNRLVETRKTVVANWNKTADLLDAQGKRILANEARYFARHLPRY